MKRYLYTNVLMLFLLMFSVIAHAQNCGGTCSGFRTQTQGGWGATPNGNNPGVYLRNNFANAFPGGLTIGCPGHSIHITSAAVITALLPTGGGPAQLPAGDVVDPSSASTVLVGQLIAATLSVGFDNYDPNFGVNSGALKDLVYNTGTFSGKTVQFVINEANNAIGGCGSVYSLSDLNDALDLLNNNYDNGTAGAGNGHLNCPGSLPEVDSVTGTFSACISLTTQLDDATAGGAWSCDDNSVATVDNAGKVTGVKVGSSLIKYTVTNGCGSTIKTATVIISDCGGVGGGSGGGLESKSLGDAVGNRIVNKAMNSLQGPVDYNKLPLVEEKPIQNKIAGVGTSLSLSEILPKQISGTNIKAFITTPSDIPAITNAKDVLSIDYTLNNEAKAVAFATKTQGEIYDHTKAICDRLKGSELLGIQNVTVNNIKLVRYDLKNSRGQMEYAMSFAIGAKNGRSNYTIQSNWLNKDYTVDEVMYNVQLWAVSPATVIGMASDIITKLNASMPVYEVLSNTKIPATYITKGKREADNIVISINNTTTSTNGYFELLEKANEQSVSTTKKQVPFTIDANGITTLKVPASDSYEATMNLYVNGILQDQVFMADGNWGVNLNANTSNIKSFKVSNAPNLVIDNKEDFVLFRNVQVEANSPDFVSVYKLLKGGGAPQDLTGFKTLQFTAAGTGVNLNITLVKEGIANWADQYSLRLPLTSNSQDFKISLDDFVAGTSKTKINPNDITTVIFSLEVTSGKMSAISAGISKVLFTKTDFAYLNSLNSKEVNVYPNPSNGVFKTSFKSAQANSLTLFVTDATTGRVVFSKPVNVQAGDNTVPVNLERKTGLNNYVLSLEGTNTKYNPKKIILLEK